MGEDARRVIVCGRVDDESAVQVMLEVQAVPVTTEAGCGHEVWVSPGTQQMMKDGEPYELTCMECLKAGLSGVRLEDTPILPVPGAVRWVERIAGRQMADIAKKAMISHNAGVFSKEKPDAER